MTKQQLSTRATVRMTPCFLADRTVLHIKSVPTDCSMVDSPCPDIASHTFSAKWTPVNAAFLFNNAILNRKLVPTNCSMVYLPCPDIASHISFAKWTRVNYAFLFHNAILNRTFFPQTVRWSICPVLTSLLTFLLQNGHV